MKEIDFHALPRSVQDRLLTAFRGEHEPKPILRLPGAHGWPLQWLGLSGGAAVLLIALWWVGFGNSASALARHPAPTAIVYVALAGALAAGVLQLLAHRAALQALPYPAGVYLFAANVIDARRTQLLVYPLDKLTSVSAGGPETIVVRFSDTTFTFPITPFDREETVDQIRDASQQVGQGLDDEERQLHDPLEPPAVATPPSSDVALSDQRPIWIRGRWVVAGAIALCGVPLYLVRNSSSDASMFAAAQARDDVPTYQGYLARGQAHREVVAAQLLPRAALRAAVAEGTVEGIQKFIAAYPDTAIQTEVDAALRAALDAAFEAARKKGTLTALLDFAHRYPKHGLEQQLAKAQHAIYAREVEQLRAKVPAASKRVVSFVSPLLTAIEGAGASQTDAGVRGPTVEVRLRRVPSRAVKGADDLVRQNAWFVGKVSYPSRYLVQERLEPHQKRAAETIAKAFQKQFEPEIVAFEAGAPLAGTDEELPAVKAPTLVISYRVEPSGAGYASKKPRCVFVGLVFFFEMTFLLPGDAEPLVLNHTAAMKIPTDIILKHDRKSPRGSLETAVYEEMLRGGFAEGQSRYVSIWFGESK